MSANPPLDFLGRLASDWANWTLAASWQLSLLVLLVALVALASCRLSARFRYLLWMLVLIKALTPPTLGASWSVGNWVGSDLWQQSRVNVAHVLGDSEPAAITDSPRPVAQPQSADQIGLASEESVAAMEPGAGVPAAPVQATAFSTSIMALAVWLAGFGVLALFVVLRYWRLTRALKRAVEVEEGPLRVTLERLAMRLGRGDPPALLLSDAVSSPFLFGLLRPRIVLPDGLPETLKPEQLEDVLLHELIHWRRHDLLASWLQILVQALFWFHPLVWLAGAQLRHERECACDEAALASGCSTARRYGESLLRVLLAARGRSAVALGFLGIFERNTRLQRRLEEIMNQENKVRRFGVGAWLALFLFAVLCVPMAAVETKSVAAKDEMPGNSTETKEASLYQEKSVTFDLQRGQEKTFHDTRFRLVRIEEGREDDRHDDRVELVVLTGHQVNNLLIQELDTQFQSDYEITVNDVVPSASSPGDGSARITIRYAGRSPATEARVYKTGPQWQRPFVDDPAVRGHWTAVDFVKEISHFDPGKKVWSGDLFLKELDFLPKGKTKHVWQSWTCGWLWHSGDKAEGQYEIRNLNGRPYLFMEWISGDVTIRGMKPAYYVFAKEAKGANAQKALSADPPRIVATSPAVGATGVDPATAAITVTFDRDMNTGGYSWTGGGPDFPKAPEGARAAWRDKRTCVFPVKLEAAKYYRIGINSTSHQKFCSAAGVPVRSSAIYFSTLGASPEVVAKASKPEIVAMDPPNGSINVDPAIKELRVTFSLPMGGGFSWTGGGPTFPKGREGQRARWSTDGKTCTFPVTLEPGKAYRLGLNSPSYKNFSSRGGVPLTPVRYTFKTRQYLAGLRDEGKATEARVYKTGPQWQRPFVDDPAVRGHWTAVDFVKEISHFDPGKKVWSGDLFLKELDFLPKGKTKHVWQSWTCGWLWHSGDKAEGQYEIRTIDGRPYLFMEWISGDVTIRGMKPHYYVFATDAERADPIVGRWRGAGSGDGTVMTFESDQRSWSADKGGASDQGRWYPGDGKYRIEDSKGQVLPFDVLVESDRLTLVSVTEPDEKFVLVREKASSNAQVTKAPRGFSQIALTLKN